MINYVIPGTLYDGITWEDFFAKDKKYPHVTITVEPDNIPADKEFFFAASDDGFVDASVKVLDKETAIKALAAINGVSVSEIEIEEKGQVVSV